MFHTPHKLFHDRREAAHTLAIKLEPYRKDHPLVLGVPRGGAEIAYHIAKYLDADFSVIMSKKIAYPKHPEYGVGAISEEEELFIPDENEYDPVVLAPVVNDLKEEIKRRIQLYRNGQPIPDPKDRVVIIADDGIATGVTLVPAIRACKKLQAKKIIVAAPVSGKNFCKELREADELIIPYQLKEFYGVGLFYEDFRQLEDNDVINFLHRFQKVNHPSA